MARVNTRVSTVATVPSSVYDASTLGSPSDQENHDPNEASRRVKRKTRTMERDEDDQQSLPTPTSDGLGSGSNLQKRKRTLTRPNLGGGGADEEEEDGKKFTRYFDPNQDVDERRDIVKRSRALERDFNESRSDLLRGDGSGLAETIARADQIFAGVKQTNDAAIDSRLLVNVSDLASKRAAHLVLGDSSTGVDVDEFLSKCITYMRNGGPANQDRVVPQSTARRRSRQHRADSDGESDDDTVGEPLDWAFLGRNACFPYNSRPPVPSFLLGPLSVEKKQRAQTQRRARQTRDTGDREARPEALTREDFSQSDENGLTAICTRIRTYLHKHIQRAERTVQQSLSSQKELETEHGRALLKRLRVADTGFPSLFDFVINPRSFGQTVENMFYVSFLIKEGSCGIVEDSDGLPTIAVTSPNTLEQQRANKTSKHQAVFALDYATWHKLIDAFDIQEPMIPHRAEEQPTQMGARGWYT